MTNPYLYIMTKVEQSLRKDGIKLIESIAGPHGCMVRLEIDGTKYSFFVMPSEDSDSIIRPKVKEVEDAFFKN